MNAFIEIKNNLPVNTDIMCAVDGLEYLGYDIRTYTKEDIISEKYLLLYNKSPFIGSISSITSILRRIEKLPEPIDFPESNYNFIGREIFKNKLSVVLEKFKSDNIPVFIKPVKTKLFDGSVLSNIDRISYFSENLNEDVFVSPIVNIVSEWRTYIHNGKIVDCRNYKGDFKLFPDFNFIEDNIKAYKNSPVSYTIDIGILDNNKNIVVEFNDFWSIGSYGLDSEIYANMLVDRWFEMIK